MSDLLQELDAAIFKANIKRMFAGMERQFSEENLQNSEEAFSFLEKVEAPFLDESKKPYPKKYHVTLEPSRDYPQTLSSLTYYADGKTPYQLCIDNTTPKKLAEDLELRYSTAKDNALARAVKKQKRDDKIAMVVNYPMQLLSTAGDKIAGIFGKKKQQETTEKFNDNFSVPVFSELSRKQAVPLLMEALVADRLVKTFIVDVEGCCGEWTKDIHTLNAAVTTIRNATSGIVSNEERTAMAKAVRHMDRKTSPFLVLKS